MHVHRCIKLNIQLLKLFLPHCDLSALWPGSISWAFFLAFFVNSKCCCCSQYCKVNGIIVIILHQCQVCMGKLHMLEMTLSHVQSLTRIYYDAHICTRQEREISINKELSNTVRWSQKEYTYILRGHVLITQHMRVLSWLANLRKMLA